MYSGYEEYIEASKRLSRAFKYGFITGLAVGASVAMLLLTMLT